MSPLLEVTEDTPPDMLAGSMDLRLVLPDGHRVRMSVDRRTPMMDLLVQVTTAYKISPAGNVLQPYGETGILPYKPSTPIGALDTWIVHIVPKNQAIQNPSNKINLKQVIPPFEQTLRFQVNLPRNQLYVTRVSGRCNMRDILIQACKEKNLDHTKYTLRHPKQLDKPLCEEMSIAEYGHNQVTMLSVKNLPQTPVSTEDILMMNKYKSAASPSDSGSGSAASSVSPIPPAQPPKPLRKRRPAPKPPVIQQQQQAETVICHSRTSSDSSGYHEASVLSESPDSNTSSLPDSLPRRSKLPQVEPKANTVDSKLSRSLSNLHQASTSSAPCSGMKPAQSTSCLVPGRKKKAAPPPPMAIAEEKEERSATLPPGSKLLEDHEEVTDGKEPSRLPNPTEEQVLAAYKRIKPRAPVPKPRPRSTAFEMNRPTPNVFVKLEGIFKKMAPPPPLPHKPPPPPPPTPKTVTPNIPSTNAENDSARLEEEIERMFEQATREHVSIESGVELSREPSPDWNWEYRLPAPPTFRDDVTAPSLADLQVDSNGSSNPILFSPLESTKEVIKDESPAATKKSALNSVDKHCENNNAKVNKTEKEKNESSAVKHIVPQSNHTENQKLNHDSKSSVEPNRQLQNAKKTEKVYIKPDNESNLSAYVNRSSEVNQKINDCKSLLENSDPSVTINNQSSDNNLLKNNEPVVAKVCINIKSESNTSEKNIGKVNVAKSDTVIRVTGHQDKNQEHSAVMYELANAINERQAKPKDPKPPEQNEKSQHPPLKNFCITTYSGSKPVEIYKESPKLEPKKEVNGIVRRNSSAEEKKGLTPVKRSASVVTNLHRRLDLSRSNGNLLEVDEFPLQKFRSNLRKTSSELSINIDSEDKPKVGRKPETGLQSLQVLRTILPQLSHSQGALNTIGESLERREEKPAVCLTTWGERPKRQVSIKTDKDYVTSGDKSEAPASVTVEMVSISKPPPAAPIERPVENDRRPRTSVYKSMETGNTKAIKLPPSDLGRLPIVRSVEFKKPSVVGVEAKPQENGYFWNVELKKQPLIEPFIPQENSFLRNVELRKTPLIEEVSAPVENGFFWNKELKNTSPEEPTKNVENGFLKQVELKKVSKKDESTPVENGFFKKQISEPNFNEKVVIRSIELKRQVSAPKPHENGYSEKPFGLTLKSACPENRQIKPPSYLFGCEPQVQVPPPPPPAPVAPAFVKLKPAAQRELRKAPSDPRAELLESIRTFGKSSLKKVSTR